MSRRFPTRMVLLAAAVLITPLLVTPSASADADVRWSVTFGNNNYGGNRGYHDSYRSRGYYDQGYSRGYDRGYSYDRSRSYGYRDRGYYCEPTVYRRPTVVQYRYQQPSYRSDYREYRYRQPGLVFNHDRYSGRRGYRSCD